MRKTLNAAAGIIGTAVNFVRSPFKSPNKRARIDSESTPPASPGLFGVGASSPFAKGITLSPSSLNKVIDATGAAAGDNNMTMERMEWGAKGGETWQQKKLITEDEDDEDQDQEKGEKKLVADDGDDDGNKAVKTESENIASQVTEVASEANWEVLAKLMAERNKQKEKEARELGLNVDRTRKIARRL